MDKENILKMLDNGITPDEIADKCSFEFCVADCGMKMPSTCCENSDCYDCWIECVKDLSKEQLGN